MVDGAPGRGYGSLVLMEKKRDGYAMLTLNRPEKRNALNLAAQAELRAALEDARDDCRAVVVTGAGNVAFCAGVDLSERLREPGDSPPPRPFAHGGNSWFEVQEAIRRHPAIFIAAVNGYALGGGLTLVHNAEIAIAAESAQFGTPEVGLGLFPALAGPATIHRVLPKHAAYLILTAERIDARTAERWGMVTEVRPDGEVLERAEQLARRIAGFDPVVLDYSKKAIREVAELGWSRAIDYGISVNEVLRSKTRVAQWGGPRTPAAPPAAPAEPAPPAPPAAGAGETGSA